VTHLDGMIQEDEMLDRRADELLERCVFYRGA
jgi:hypothetical protein